MSGGLVVVGALFSGCPPGKPSSSELVRHFPRLPPGTHGFAGGGLPLEAGCTGLAVLALALAGYGDNGNAPVFEVDG